MTAYSRFSPARGTVAAGLLLTGDAIVTIKSSALFLAGSMLAVLSLSACGPAPTNFANPTVRGNNSTIAGDKDATDLRKAQ
jgi:hypothetical protein